jgi:RNA polymerase sigma-70 factor (ECF subfamily)
MKNMQGIESSHTTKRVERDHATGDVRAAAQTSAAPLFMNEERANEMQLAQAIVRGDIHSFDTFYERYVDRLYRVIYYQLGAHQADADDVLQDTMIAALSALPRFRGESRLFTWLCGIAHHKITDHRRKGGPAGERVGLSLTDYVVPQGGSDLYSERAEARIMVRQALAELPAAHKQVIILKYVQGLSVEEIAAATGRSFKSVESLLTRAREGLRAALQQETGDRAHSARTTRTQ